MNCRHCAQPLRPRPLNETTAQQADLGTWYDCTTPFCSVHAVLQPHPEVPEEELRDVLPGLDKAPVRQEPLK